MDLREWIEKNKHITTPVSVVILVLAIGLIIYQLLPERPETKAWYTVDDGKTWFKDSNRKVPPFEHDGKQAVLAKVYKCDGKPFVAWLERYKPEQGKKLAEYRAQEDAGQTPDEALLMAGGGLGAIEYKKPGAGEWTTELNLITDMMQVNCPDGSPGIIVAP